MSHILIIGGMGPQASIYAHRRLIDVAYHRGARTNEDYPQITHLSINVPDFISNTTQRDKARAILIKALESIDSESVTAGFIVNTTSLGMKGDGAIDLDFSVVSAGVVVTDIVYVPLETPFLTSAASRGLRTVDGLGMLLHQAVPGFTRWFGQRPSVTAELRVLIEADL